MENRLPTTAEVDDYEREATELVGLDEYTRDSSTVRHRSPAGRLRAGTQKRDSPVRKRLPLLAGMIGFWTHHVQLTVPHDECRDHLGESHAKE